MTYYKACLLFAEKWKWIKDTVLKSCIMLDAKKPKKLFTTMNWNEERGL